MANNKYDFSNVKLAQLKRMKQYLDGIETLRNMAVAREEFKKKQQAINYRNEYDRIRGELSKGGIYSLPVRSAMQQREGKLKKWSRDEGFIINDKRNRQ
jgi:hypothetical protein